MKDYYKKAKWYGNVEGSPTIQQDPIDTHYTNMDFRLRSSIGGETIWFQVRLRKYGGFGGHGVKEKDSIGIFEGEIKEGVLYGTKAWNENYGGWILGDGKPPRWVTIVILGVFVAGMGYAVIFAAVFDFCHPWDELCLVNGKISKLEKEINNLKFESEKLENENKLLEQKITDAASIGDGDSIQNAIQANEQLISDSELEIEKTNDKITELESENKLLEQRLDNDISVKEEIDIRGTKVKNDVKIFDLKREIKDMNDKITELESENKLLEQMITDAASIGDGDSIQNAIQANEQLISDIERKINILNPQLEEIKMKRHSLMTA